KVNVRFFSLFFFTKLPSLEVTKHLSYESLHNYLTRIGAGYQVSGRRALVFFILLSILQPGGARTVTRWDCHLRPAAETGYARRIGTGGPDRAGSRRTSEDL